MADSKPKPTKQFADDDLIQCGICHIDIENPRSLVCLHTYCLRCLREWSKDSKDEVTCPLCREPTPLPANGVDGLRSNFLITKLKERKALSRQLLKKYVKKIVCTSCDVSDGNVAVTRCFECDGFLCTKCTEAHKITRLTKNHSILSLVELRSGEVSLIKKTKEEQHCTEHTGQVIWFYCKTCDVPICRDCTVIEHQAGSHELVKLGTATAAQRDQIQKLIAKCQVVKTEVDEALQKVPQMREDLESSLGTVNAAIDAKRDKVMKTLSMLVDKEVDDLKKLIAEMVSTKQQSSKVHEDELQLLSLRLNTALEMGSTVTTDGSDCDIASAYKPLTATLTQLGKTKVPVVGMGDINFTEEKSDVVFTPRIGRIKGKSMTTTQRETGAWNKPWKMVKKFRGAGKGKLKDARGVAINEDGDVAVADYDGTKSKVYVFDIDDGKLKLAIDTTKSLHYNPSSYTSYPFGLAVYEGNYVVTDTTYSPTVYDIHGNYVKQIKIDKYKADLTYGIAFDSIGHALVGNDSKSHIGVQNYSDDSFVFSIDTPIHARYICVSSSDDNKIIISANDSEGAQVIDSKGKTIHDLHPPQTSLHHDTHLVSVPLEKVKTKKCLSAMVVDLKQECTASRLPLASISVASRIRSAIHKVLLLRTMNGWLSLTKTV